MSPDMYNFALWAFWNALMNPIFGKQIGLIYLTNYPPKKTKLYHKEKILLTFTYSNFEFLLH